MPSEPLPNPHIVTLKGYVPGEQPQGGGWIKLNTNENPYPPSPRVVEAIKKHLETDGAALRLYPSPDSAPLRKAVAELHGYNAENIVAGNGSDDILNLLVRAYADSNRPIGMLDPSYSLYPVIAAIQGASVVKVPIGQDFSLDINAVVNSGASIFFLTNPNAPLGISFSAKNIEELAQVFSGILVVDEAYADFAEEDCTKLPLRYPNVVVTRTLSKSYSLAGMRVGYALCSSKVAEILHRVRDSYNVDRLAQVAAVAALEDREWLQKNIEKIKSTRTRLISELTQLGWKINPSLGNFILAKPRSKTQEFSSAAAESAFNFFKERKILVRRFPHHPLTEKSLRITVGTDAEMDGFLKAARVWTEG
jgi:histidinol-phosphate aminotransferase